MKQDQPEIELVGILLINSLDQQPFWYQRFFINPWIIQKKKFCLSGEFFAVWKRIIWHTPLTGSSLLLDLSVLANKNVKELILNHLPVPEQNY